MSFIYYPNQYTSSRCDVVLGAVFCFCFVLGFFWCVHFFLFLFFSFFFVAVLFWFRVSLLFRVFFGRCMWFCFVLFFFPISVTKSLSFDQYTGPWWIISAERQTADLSQVILCHNLFLFKRLYMDFWMQCKLFTLAQALLYVLLCSL